MPAPTAILTKPWARIAAWALGGLVLLAPFKVSAGSVTVVTHGFQLDNNRPAWVDAMAAAIANRAGPGAAQVSIEVGRQSDGSLGVTAFSLDAGQLPSATSTNAEVVIKLFWNTVAGLTDAVPTTDIATAFLPYLINPVTWPGNIQTRPFAELPLHLIGHSRGASVMTELSQLLGSHGVWVDHLSTLDPHPLSPADCIGFFCPPVNDPPLQLFENVIFADNYRETDDSGTFLNVSGYSIPGSAELDLTPRFSHDGLADSENSDHLEVHDWYHGTVDATAISAAGSPIPRAVWYNTNDIGFQFSSLAGGDNLRFAPQTNYTGSGLRWARATRTSFTARSGVQWPNLQWANSSNLWTLHPGQILPMTVWYQSANATNLTTIEFFADTDRNPYNNANLTPFAAISGSFPSNAVTQLTQPWTAPESSRAARQYLCAKIQDLSGATRYFYLDQPIDVVPSPGPWLSISRPLSGSTKVGLTGQTGVAYSIQISADLVHWSDYTNVIGSGIAPVFISDPAPASMPKRFYRAEAKP